MKNIIRRISKWSIAGMIFGLIFAAGSFIRYYFLWQDIDKAIVYPLVGILIFCISWLYNERLQLSYRLEAIEEYITDKEDKE